MLGNSTDSTKERILSACIRLLARLPFSRITMNDVAGESGVTKPMIYYYFTNKQGLYMAAARAMLVRARAELEKILAQDLSLRETLVALGRGRLEVIKREPELVRAHLSLLLDPGIREMISSLQDELADLHRMILPAFGRAVRSGEIRSDFDFELAAKMFHGVLNAYIVRVIHGHLAPDELPDPEDVANILFKGIEARRGVQP